MMKVLAGLVSSEPSVLGLQMATVSLPLHTAAPLCTRTQCLFLYDTSQIRLGPTLTGSFSLKCPFKGPAPNTFPF